MINRYIICTEQTTDSLSLCLPVPGKLLVVCFLRSHKMKIIIFVYCGRYSWSGSEA